MIDFFGLLIQFVVGGLIGLFFGTIILYIAGSIVCMIRGKTIDRQLDSIRHQHNFKIKKLQKQYDNTRKEFLRVLRLYRRNISKMEVDEECSEC